MLSDLLFAWIENKKLWKVWQFIWEQKQIIRKFLKYIKKRSSFQEMYDNADTLETDTRFQNWCNSRGEMVHGE